MAADSRWTVKGYCQELQPIVAKRTHRVTSIPRPLDKLLRGYPANFLPFSFLSVSVIIASLWRATWTRQAGFIFYLWSPAKLLFFIGCFSTSRNLSFPRTKSYSWRSSSFPPEGKKEQIGKSGRYRSEMPILPICVLIWTGHFYRTVRQWYNKP